METVTLSLTAAESLVFEALRASGASQSNAGPIARALIAAERDGQKGHGLSRAPSYCAQIAAGKVNGAAAPVVTPAAPGVLRVDVGHGFPYPAFEAVIPQLADLAQAQGIALAAIHRSHHYGVAGHVCEALAERGCAAFIYGNSPKALAPHGAKQAALGTNPVAFAAPIPGAAPLVIDLAVTEVARGKILAAKETGQQIPPGWALDAEGAPTTDPEAALNGGSMAPIAGAKGAALALMVEVMSAVLVGGRLGVEASSLMTPDGPAPDIAQSIVAIDVNAASGGAYGERMTALAQVYEDLDGARLPGTRRLTARAAAAEGLSVPASLIAKIRAIAEDA